MSPGEMKRREFLGLCGAGALSGLLTSCQLGPINVNRGGSTTPYPARPSSTPTEEDWSTLAKSMQGTLVRPNSPQYTTALQLFDPRYDSVQPEAIAYCASPADVQNCLALVRRFNLPFAPRCGGHSYVGNSTSKGLIIDVTKMNTVNVNTGNATSTIGAGTRLIDVYSALTQQGLILPAGSCPTVGIAGLTLGGGAGVLDRKFGLTCDNLLSAQVVTADGRILTCDTRHNSDLFWALRGGGGGNFGVVTSFTFQVHPLTSVSLFTLAWPWSSAASVVDAWQRWAPQAPDEIWSNCLLDAPANKQASPIIQVNGVYVGPVTPLNALLQQLTSQIDVAPTSKYVSEASVLDAMLYEAGCSGESVNACHLPSQHSAGQVQRVISSVKSDYFTSLLPRPAIDILVSAITNRFNTASLGEGGIGMDAYGGAINRVAASATAFVHRNALFSAQYSASWQISDPSSVVTANHSWQNNMWQAMRPYASGAAYQNYVDPDLSDWQHAYYGDNLSRLQQVKAIYDPENLFHFAQSIPPA